jgi:hypothetical protein
MRALLELFVISVLDNNELLVKEWLNLLHGRIVEG